MPVIQTNTDIENRKTYSYYTENYTERQAYNDDDVYWQDLREVWLQTTAEGKKELARRERINKLYEAAIEERGLFKSSQPSLELATWYFDNFAEELPEHLRYWSRRLNQKAWRGFNKKNQPYKRYFDSFFDAYFYTLRLDDLTISKKIRRRIDKATQARPDLNLEDALQLDLNADLLKAIVRDNLIFGAVLVKLEASDNFQVHIHVIAERMALCPHLKRLEAKQQGKCVPVYETQGMMAYLLKGSFTMKRYDPSKPEDVQAATLKLAGEIESRKRYKAATGKRGANLLEFYGNSNNKVFRSKKHNHNHS